MKLRRVVWPAVAVLASATVAVAVPGSPLYLPNFFGGDGRHYDGHHVRYWVQALYSTDAETRLHGIHALGAIGAEADEAVPALATILVEDPDRGARIEASLALSKMAPASQAALPALTRALDDREGLVRMNAVLALMRLQGAARPAVPALVLALKDEANRTNLNTFTFTIQEAAARALGQITAGSGEAVPALLDALQEAETDRLRKAVVGALGEVGAEARTAAPRLRALLRDGGDDVREAALEALLKIEGKPLSESELAQLDRPQDLKLPEVERKYLWEIEHHGNLLVKHGFALLAAALKNADAAALSRLLADDFAGTDLRDPKRVRAASDYAEVERLQDAGRPPLPLDRGGFVARLLQLRSVFPQAPPQVKLALMTLSPKVRGRLDGSWEGTAQLRLHGEYAKGAPAEVVAMLRYELPRPTEEALARPGWLRAAGVEQVLTSKAPHYLFAEVARQCGLDASKLHDNWKTASLPLTTGGVFVCDFDRDGILDVLITDLTGQTLYRGCPGGSFEDVTTRYGLPTQPLGSQVAAWVDLDGDGWEDLLLADRVYRNEKGEHFADYTSRCDFHLPPGAGGVVVADFDRDGRLDLYVTRSAPRGSRSWMEGKSGDANSNRLIRNKGNWQFEDVTRASGAGGGRRSTFTAAWLDANNDGWPDLHVLNEFGDGVLLVNQGNGTFREHALADRPADFGSMGLAVGDVDNDGNIDIYCANMYSKAGSRVIGNLAPDAYPPPVLERMRRFVAGSQLHLNKGGLKFEQVGKPMQVAAVGWAYGACLADLDNDGWLDIYGTAGFVSRNRDEPDG